MTVESSLFATIANESSDHGVASAPLDLVHVLMRRISSALASRPDLDGSSAADDRVERKREYYVRFVVYFSLNLPLAYVLVASFACVLDKHKFSIRTDLFDSHWAFGRALHLHSLGDRLAA